MIEVTLDSSIREAVERAERMLAAMPGGFEKALRSAISRTASHTRTRISRRVRERYAINAGNLRTEQNIHLQYRSKEGGAEAVMRIVGTKLPLYRFEGASPKAPTNQPHLVPVLIGDQSERKWRMVHPGVTARGKVLRGSGPKTLTDSFVATFRSGHTGIFERTGGMTANMRDEIKEKMGLSIPQMVGNDEVLANLSQDAAEKFDERIDHEIAAILNGWR